LLSKTEMIRTIVIACFWTTFLHQITVLAFGRFFKIRF
jgi:hypothetical protein